MADFTKPTVGDMAMNGADHHFGIDGSMQLIDWDNKDAHWRENHAHQPYATADRPYDFYQ
ncbi:MAG: hypothetical protein ABI442_11275 [Gemmatimonadaceae bacterium]